MKITTKILTTKEKICDKCPVKTSCGDLPGFCMLLYYALIASLVVVLLYFLITMSL
ncbi:MAG: hypothetical protein GQ550_08820 [Gammaproteobacteria bacterium]|nr:hypothetical protein [Gammaproteobacteria bacterium]